MDIKLETYRCTPDMQKRAGYKRGAYAWLAVVATGKDSQACSKRCKTPGRDVHDLRCTL